MTTGESSTTMPDPLVLCFLRAARRGRELRLAQAKRRGRISKRALTKVVAQTRKRPTGV